MNEREIKFRAFHNGKMLTDKNSNLILRNGGFLIEEIDFSSMPMGLGNKDYNPLDDAILMQFTGLNDKNGNEIYEGDICYDGIQKFEIKYDIQKNTHSGHGDCTYTVSCGFHLGGYGNESGKIEVIGNIHENPELLK